MSQAVLREAPGAQLGHPTAARPRTRSFAWGYAVRELRRPFRRQALLFTVGLPAVLYLALFHTGSSDVSLPHGNFAAWMMIGIAVYGAAASATSSAASISVERASGWMRTIRLTPMTTATYVLVKVAAAMGAAIVPVAVVGVLGYLTGARADAHVWVYGLALAWAGSAIFAAFGLALGLALRPEVVIHTPGLVVTGLAFLGNLFIPLSGTMLTIGSYTPMFGVAALARYVLTDGYTMSGAHFSLAAVLINTVGWFMGFCLAAGRRFRQSTGRV